MRIVLKSGSIAVTSLKQLLEIIDSNPTENDAIITAALGSTDFFNSMPEHGPVFLSNLSDLEKFSQAIQSIKLKKELYKLIATTSGLFSCFFQRSEHLIAGYLAFPSSEIVHDIFDRFFLTTVFKGEKIETNSTEKFIEKAKERVPVNMHLAFDFSALTYLFASAITGTNLKDFEAGKVYFNKKFTLSSNQEQSNFVIRKSLITFFHQFAELIISKNNIHLYQQVWNFYNSLRKAIPDIQTNPRTAAIKDIPANLEKIRASVENIEALYSNTFHTSAEASIIQSLHVEYKGYIFTFQQTSQASHNGLCLADSVGISNPIEVLRQIIVELRSSPKHQVIDYLSRAIYNDLQAGELESDIGSANLPEGDLKRVINQMLRLHHSADATLMDFLRIPNNLIHYVTYLLEKNYYNSIVGELLLNYPNFNLPVKIIGIVKQFKTSRGEINHFIIPPSDQCELVINDKPNPNIKWVLLSETNDKNHLKSSYNPLDLIEVAPKLTTTVVVQPAAAVPRP